MFIPPLPLVFFVVLFNFFHFQLLSVEGAKKELYNLFKDYPPIYTNKRPFIKQSPIAIVTFSDPRTEHCKLLSPITTPNKAQYASFHSYDFINAFEHEDIQTDYIEHSIIHSYSAPHYYKLRLLAYLLRKYKYKWIMWSDTDALFLNFSKKITKHLDDRFDFVFTTNPPGQSKWQKIINTGHFLVKNSNWSIKFLYQAYALSFIDGWDYLEGKAPLNGWLKMCVKRGDCIWHDQRILQYYISYLPNELYGCHFKYVHFFNFNSEFPQYLPGDMVLHFPGQPNHLRVRWMKQILENCDHSTGTIDYKKVPEVKPKVGKDTTHYSNEKFISFNKPCQS